MGRIVDKSGKRHERILIAMPCGDSVNAGTAYDLAALAGYEGGREIALLMDRDTLLPAQRARIVEHALQTNASHILWIDSDMRFPKDALSQLLKHEQDIVAANYTRRRPPHLPTAEDSKKGYLFDSLMATGLAEVGHAGMGLMLTATIVFETIKRPWFAVGYSPNSNTYGGEDVFFCRQAQKNGFPILIDMDLSKHVKHVGEMPFTLQHSNVTRDAVNAADAAKDT